MILTNHIANRLLNDNEEFVAEIIADIMESKQKTLGSGQSVEVEEFADVYHLLNSRNNKSYYITHTVMDKLQWFDTKKCMTVEGWKVFSHLAPFKDTYVLPLRNDGSSACIRVIKNDTQLYFCHIHFTKDPNPEKDPYKKKVYYGLMNRVLFWVDLGKGMLCSHFKHQDTKECAPFLYALMCFIKLTANEEITLESGRSYGTRKQGKVINIFKEPLIIVNNTWNITVNRTTGFPVSGHPHLYWTGEGRKIPVIKFLEPFMKDGYRRKSGKELSESE